MFDARMFARLVPVDSLMKLLTSLIEFERDFIFNTE